MDFNSHFKISITIILWKNVQIGNEEIKIYDGKSIKTVWRDQTSCVHVNRNRAKLYHVQSLTTCTGTIFIFLFFSSSIDWRFNWRPIFIWDVPYFAPICSFIGYNLFNGFIDRGCVSPKHRRNFITDTQTNGPTPP